MAVTSAGCAALGVFNPGVTPTASGIPSVAVLVLTACATAIFFDGCVRIIPFNDFPSRPLAASRMSCLCLLWRLVPLAATVRGGLAVWAALRHSVPGG